MAEKRSAEPESSPKRQKTRIEDVVSQCVVSSLEALATRDRTVDRLRVDLESKHEELVDAKVRAEIDELHAKLAARTAKEKTLSDKIAKLKQKLASQEEKFKLVEKLEKDLEKGRATEADLHKQVKELTQDLRTAAITNQKLKEGPRKAGIRSAASYTYDVYIIEINGTERKFVTAEDFDATIARFQMDLDFTTERHNAITRRLETELRSRKDVEEHLEKILVLQKRHAHATAEKQ